MSLRARLTVVSAVAVAVAIALASIVSFVFVKRELVKQVDRSLVEQAAQVAEEIHQFPDGGFALPPAPFGVVAGYVQFVNSAGEVARPENEPVALPTTPQTRDVAAGRRLAFYNAARVSGVHVRIYTARVAPSVALQIARPLTEMDATLSRLAVILVLVTFAGTALAAAAGMLVARSGLAPVRRLTETAERVTATGDLSQRIETTGSDEVGRLASQFNSMLDALQAAQAAQRQLVADASHELRTPLTSLRTNIEVLARGDPMPKQERDRLLADVVAELEEFSVLVGDLVDLARDQEPAAEPEHVRLDELVAYAVERAHRHAPGITFRTDLQPSLVEGVPSRIDRAISNLLDNAVKWSPPDGVIEVGAVAGEVTVRDHGPGIPEEDLPFVFDRFYRATGGRGLPGSGLGLAIVRQVAESHGGSAAAENVEGGGARLTLKLSANS